MMTTAMVCTNALPGKFLFILNFSIPFFPPLWNLAKEKILNQIGNITFPVK